MCIDIDFILFTDYKAEKIHLGCNEKLILLIKSLDWSNKYDLSVVTYLDRNKFCLL